MAAEPSRGKKGGILVLQAVMRQFDVISAKIHAIKLPLAKVVLSNLTIVKLLMTEIDVLKVLLEGDVRSNLYLRD